MLGNHNIAGILTADRTENTDTRPRGRWMRYLKLKFGGDFTYTDADQYLVTTNDFVRHQHWESDY